MPIRRSVRATVAMACLGAVTVVGGAHGIGRAGRTEVPLALRHRLIQLDRDPSAEGLAVGLDVRLPLPGTWSVTASLTTREACDGSSLLRTVASVSRTDLIRIASGGRATGIPDTVVTSPSGKARVEVCFDGSQLARLCAEGAWDVQVRMERVQTRPGASTEQVFRATVAGHRRNSFEVRYAHELEPYRNDPMNYFFAQAPPMELVFTQGWDLVIAEVVEADTGGTQGHPPKVRLHVTRALQGKPGPRTLDITWDAEAPYIPCMTGEEATMARWEAVPQPGPSVGSRWILGVSFSTYDNAWHGEELCRLPYSDSLLARLEPEVREWQRLVPRLRQAREKWSADRVLQEERMARRQRQERVEKRRVWLFDALQRARTVDVDTLLENADCVAVGELDLRNMRWTDVGNAIPFKPLDRLRWHDGWKGTSIQLLAGDEHVIGLWQGLGEEPGPGEPDRVVPVIVFAHHAWIPQDHAEPKPPHPVLRLVNGTSSVQLADPQLITRVRRALAARPAWDGDWRAFASLPESALATVSVRFSPLFLPVPVYVNRRSLVLETTTSAHQYVSSGRVRFWPNALPDSVYRVDMARSSWSSLIRTDEMAGLLDSLTSLAAVREQRVVATDSMSLRFHRRSGSRDLFFECTLDPATVDRVARILTEASMPPEHYVGPLSKRRPSQWMAWNLPTWLNAVSPAYVKVTREASLRYPPPSRTPQ